LAESSLRTEADRVRCITVGLQNISHSDLLSSEINCWKWPKKSYQSHWKSHPHDNRTIKPNA